jgi:hypothetical protein
MATCLIRVLQSFVAAWPYERGQNKILVQKIFETTFFLSTQSGLSIGVCLKVSLKIYFISAKKEFHILNKKLKFKKFICIKKEGPH